MQCPACKNTLSSRVVSNLTLDVCDNGCGGIWFDHFELKKLEDPQVPDAETLLNLHLNSSVKTDHDQQRKCPKCVSFIMMKHFADAVQKVKIDECPNCAGFWLDAGELHELHSEFNTEAERVQAAEKLFDNMFGAKLAAIHQEDQATAEKLNRISRGLRFVCPSYYLGKMK
jgi:Zn-finger nucleic acid-binding protein